MMAFSPGTYTGASWMLSFLVPKTRSNLGADPRMSRPLSRSKTTKVASAALAKELSEGTEVSTKVSFSGSEPLLAVALINGYGRTEA